MAQTQPGIGWPRIASLIETRQRKNCDPRPFKHHLHTVGTDDACTTFETISRGRRHRMTVLPRPQTRARRVSQSGDPCELAIGCLGLLSAQRLTVPIDMVPICCASTAQSTTGMNWPDEDATNGTGATVATAKQHYALAEFWNTRSRSENAPNLTIPLARVNPTHTPACDSNAKRQLHGHDVVKKRRHRHLGSRHWVLGQPFCTQISGPTDQQMTAISAHIAGVGPLHEQQRYRSVFPPRHRHSLTAHRPRQP